MVFFLLLRLLNEPNGTLEITSSALVIGREVLLLLPRIQQLMDAEKIQIRATLMHKVIALGF